MIGILGADFAAEAQEGTTEDAAAFRVSGGLAVEDVVEVVAKAIEGRDLGGEHLVQARALVPASRPRALPCESGFGVEEMIEAAFPDAGLQANGIHGG